MHAAAPERSVKPAGRSRRPIGAPIHRDPIHDGRIHGTPIHGAAASNDYTLFNRPYDAERTAPVANDLVTLFVSKLVLMCADMAVENSRFTGEMLAVENHAHLSHAHLSTRFYTSRGTYRNGRWLDEGAEAELGDFGSLGEVGIIEELRIARDRGNAAGFSSGQEYELAAELRAARYASQLERERKKHDTGKSVKEWFWFEP